MVNLLPFMYVVRIARVVIDGVVYGVLLYGAYNALGLIGPEDNGIAVVNETRKCVVLDGHVRNDYGWYEGFRGPAKFQVAEFERIAALRGKQFLDFVRAHPRFRGESEL
jgi:hypothetical protein